MKSKVKSSTLSNEFENLLADIDSLLHVAKDLSGDELKAVTSKLHDRVNEAKSSVVDIKVDLEKQARKTATKLDQEVHDEPWKAVGIGAAIGLLLGLVISRR